MPVPATLGAASARGFGQSSNQSTTRSMFAQGEQGVWYDPQDFKPNWRRNLLTYTEQFDNAAWAKTNLSGGNKIVYQEGGATLTRVANQTITYTGPLTQIVYSVDLSPGYLTWAIVSLYDSNSIGARISVNLATQTAGSRSDFNGPQNPIVTVTPISGGITRVTVSVKSTTNTVTARIGPLDSDQITGFTSTSNGTTNAMINVISTQLELGSTASDYQKITDGVQDYYTYQPQPVLFQDQAGTIPVTAVEQPVRLMLDKSRGLALGSELVTNGDFSNGITGWSAVNGATISQTTASAAGITDFGTGNILKVVSNGTSSGAVQAMTTQIGISYVINASCYGVNVASSTILVGTSAGGFDILTIQPWSNSINAWDTKQIRFTATSTTTYVTFCASQVTGRISYFDNISIKSLAGNHAYATADANRPTLSARYNLLTKTEQFDDAAWTRLAANITANATTAPDGTNTADKLVEDATTNWHSIRQSAVTLTNGVSYVFSVYAKAAEETSIALSDVPGATGATFNLSTGTAVITGTDAGLTLSNPTISSIGNGWYKCSIIMLASSGSRNPVIYLRQFATSFAGTAGNGLYIWGADLRVSDFTKDLPAYQRVNTSTDYDTNGFPLYLAANGSSTAMQTNSIDFSTVTSDGQTRRNLLTYPTAFDNPVYTNGNVTVTPNVITAPNGTLTADKIVEAATTAVHQLQGASITVAIGSNYTYSVYAKKAERTTLFLMQSGIFGTYDLSAGTCSGTGTSITSVGNDWYRCSYVFTAASSSVGIRHYINSSSSYTGDGVSGLYLWGAQYEAGSVATAFQDIGTDKMTIVAGVRKLSDATLYAAICEYGVRGIVNSFGLYGPNSGINTYGYTSQASSVVTVESPTVYSVPNSQVLTGQSTIDTPSVKLRLNGVQLASSTATQGTGGYSNYPLYLFARNNGASLWFNGYFYGMIIRGAQTSDVQLARLETDMAVRTPGAETKFTPSDLFKSGEEGVWYDPSDFNPDWRTNLLTYSEDFENAAWTKSNAGIQYNLLKYTEQFDNSVWSKGTGTPTITANSLVAPDGTTTADKLLASNTSGAQSIYQAVTATAVGYTYSVYAKAGEVTWLGLSFGSGATVDGAFFDLENGVIGTRVSGTGAKIEDAGNGWFRCSINRLLTAASYNATIEVHNADNQGSWNSATTAGIYIWGSQFAIGDQPRVNLLTKTEQFDDVAWIPSFVSVSANSTIAPDGTTTADTITATGSNSYIYNTFTSTNNTSYTFTCYVKSVSVGTTLNISLYTQSGASNIASSSFTTTGSWQRVSVTGTYTTGQTACWAAIGGSGSFQTGATLYVWGADIRLASTPASLPSYQKVVSATDYNTIGFESLINAGDYTQTTSTSLPVKYTGPFGGQVAEKLIEDTANTEHRLRVVTISKSPSSTLTYSAYIKPSGRYVQLSMENSGTGIQSVFDVVAGTWSTIDAAGWTRLSTAVTPVGDGWYRCSISALTDTNATVNVRIELASTTTGGANQIYTGNGTSGILIYGAQLQRGSTVSTYQRITDVNSDFLKAYPNTTLYQDSAGTTPVTSVEQAVGLILDKSKGLTLGSELVTNGTFDTDSDWIKGAGWTISGGTAILTNNSTAIYQSISTSIRNKWIKISWSSNLNLQIRVDGSSVGYFGAGSISTIYYVSGSANAYLEFIANGTQTGTLDNISVKEIAGNHAFQATAGNRPTLSSRVNLLAKTEDFTNILYWQGTNGASVTLDTSISGPAGTSSINKIVGTQATTLGDDTGSKVYYLSNTNSTTNSAISITGSVWLYSASGGSFQVSLYQWGGTNYYQTFSLSPATWTRVKLSNAFGVSTGQAGIAIYAGNATIFATGADLRFTSIGNNLPSYQRVNTSTDYDTVGFPVYLAANGSSTAMATNSINFSSTDKMTVVTGVRRLGSDRSKIILEFTPLVTNTGGFAIYENDLTTGDYNFQMQNGYRYSALSAPSSNVLSVNYDRSQISTDLQISPRINGAVPTLTSSGSPVAASNFVSNSLYLFARNNSASSWFNGYCYGMIIRGAQSDNDTVTKIENYINKKSGGLY